MRADRIRAALDEDLIVLVAGFQGVSTAKDVTTLGRGGSDTTAVALAAAIGAEVCEIYTDVAGVFTADPRIVPDARKLPVVSFEEMLEMSASGAGVLQLRSVEYARNHGVRIHCRSTFTEEPGTFVVGEEETMERPLITAVTHSTDEARITLLGVPDHPGIAGRIFTALADANVNVDMIIQNEPESEGAQADMSFTVPRSDLRDAREALEPVVAEVGIGARRRGPRDGQGLGRRRGNEDAPRRRRQGVLHARRRGDQHRDDLHVADQDLVRRARATQVDRGRRALHEAFELGADQIERRAPVRSRRGRDELPRRRRGRHRRRRHRHARRSCASAASRRARSSRSPPSARRAASSTASAIVQPLTDETIQGFDLALFSAGRDDVGRVGAALRRRGRGRRRQLVVVRRDDEVPLVVAEVNPHALDGHKGLIANPNCSTMQLMVALKPIHDAAGIERLIVSTYQSVSGTGVKAVEELEEQTHAELHGQRAARAAGLPAPDRVQRARRRRQLHGRRRLHRRRAQDDVRDAQDPRGDETSDLGHLRARAGDRTALGVGERADARADRARGGARAAARRPGIDGRRRPGDPRLPDGARGAGRDEVFVGRIRRDPSHERALNMWVVSDNLLKGAATNAVQIAEVLHERGLVRVPARQAGAAGGARAFERRGRRGESPRSSAPSAVSAAAARPAPLTDRRRPRAARAAPAARLDDEVLTPAALAARRLLDAPSAGSGGVLPATCPARRRRPAARRRPARRARRPARREHRLVVGDESPSTRRTGPRRRRTPSSAPLRAAYRAARRFPRPPQADPPPPRPLDDCSTAALIRGSAGPAGGRGWLASPRSRVAADEDRRAATALAPRHTAAGAIVAPRRPAGARCARRRPRRARPRQPRRLGDARTRVPRPAARPRRTAHGRAAAAACRARPARPAHACRLRRAATATPAFAVIVQALDRRRAPDRRGASPPPLSGTSRHGHDDAPGP